VSDLTATFAWQAGLLAGFLNVLAFAIKLLIG
jgi:hypothetical protein